MSHADGWGALRLEMSRAGDGGGTAFAQDLAACGVGGFWMECFTDQVHMVKHFGRTHVRIGNAGRRILTCGTAAAIEAETRRCLNRGRNCPGHCVCMRGHSPPKVPVSSALLHERTYRTYGIRR